MTNSTFSGNTAAVGGGALANTGSTSTLTVTNSTFAGNSAPAGSAITNIANTVNLRNNLIVGAAPACANLAGTTAGTTNLESPGPLATCGPGTTVLGTNPLGSNTLTSNGGPTQTIALAPQPPTNPAVNTATVVACPPRDQRYASRVGNCDIGAFELGGTLPANPTITKAFNPTNVLVGNTTTLTFTVSNPAGNPPLTNLQFVDTLSSGLSVSAPITPAQCGGTVSSTGPQNIGFSGGSLPAGPSTCTISVPVRVDQAGALSNTGANLSGFKVGEINSAAPTDTIAIPPGSISSTVNGVAAPTIRKTFAPTAIRAGEAATITITITNPAGNPALSGIGFVDTLQAGLRVVTPLATPQCGGTVSSSGRQNITFGGGSLPAGPSTCTVTVRVTVTAPGDYQNSDANLSGFTTTQTGPIPIPPGSTSSTLTVALPGPGGAGGAGGLDSYLPLITIPQR